MIKVGRVRSVSEYLRKAHDVACSWNDWSNANEWTCWFRGEPQAISKTALRPRLFRPAGKKTKKLLYLEQELRLEFKRCGAQLVSGVSPSSVWEWYFTMQHYGVPTRLLDWTDSALVALFFAIEHRETASDTSLGTNAAVYALDPWWLNHKAFLRYRSDAEGVALSDWSELRKYLPKELNNEDLSPKLPMAIDPTHLFGRVAAQRSRFVIFGKDRDVLWEIARRKAARVALFEIQSKWIRSMKAELRTSGLSRSSIFPDLDGLATELADWFNENTS